MALPVRDVNIDALYKDGSPRLVVGSPGFGFVHGPYQVGTGIVEWGLPPAEAVRAPRFTFPAKLGWNETRFERHYDESVLAMLCERRDRSMPNIDHGRGTKGPPRSLIEN